MKTLLYLQDESEHIKVLRRLLIMDSDPENCFDFLPAYCRFRFRVGIALVSLVGFDRQWFKSGCGLASHDPKLDCGFCGDAHSKDEVMIVSDARQDDHFRGSPLVLGPPFVRFYAGAPLRLASGLAVGTLCLLDAEPKRLEAEDIEHLMVLARMVSMELENLGQLENCRKHCLYGLLAQECPFKKS